MVKVTVDKEKCIGCGACTSISDNFELKDGKAIVKDPEPKEVGDNQEAADICPVKAIVLKD